MSSIPSNVEKLRAVDVVITGELDHRVERPPQLLAEVAAFRELSVLLAEDPRRAVRRFVELALQLCSAGSAGLSLLRVTESGDAVFHWEALSGVFHPHEGGETPRDFSPCGLCLDAGQPILVSRPARMFDYLQGVDPAIEEGLIVPLYDTARRPLGTIWLAHHDPAARFSATDMRIVEQLAIQLVLALKLVKQAREHRDTLASLASRRNAHRSVESDLLEERARRERAEVAESGIRQAMIFKDAQIHEVHHRVKNTIQMVASLLSLQARASPIPEVRTALRDGNDRLQLLAKVHELLYSNANTTEEILMPPLLQAIGNALRSSFGEMAARVRLSVASEPIVLTPDDAIPLALLANEVITNAYKHAFPAGAAGEIRIDLRSIGDVVTLHMADNGVGMRGVADDRGLGLKLIVNFAAQLRGNLSFDEPVSGVGTGLKLTIQRDTKRSSSTSPRKYESM